MGPTHKSGSLPLAGYCLVRLVTPLEIVSRGLIILCVALVSLYTKTCLLIKFNKMSSQFIKKIIINKNS